MTRGFIFDLDGTIYLDSFLIEGAKEAIFSLKENGDKVVFLTNKSIESREDYVQKLNKLGIETNIEEVINSNYVTGLFLKRNLNENEKVFVIGEQPLHDELKELGIEVTHDPLKSSYVVVGWDRNFHYKQLNNAYQAWANGAKIVATNPDRTCPTSNGRIPDCAGMIGAIEGVTGQKVDFIAGKPSKIMAEYVVNEVLKLEPSQCYMVGDRLETDILMGNENDLNSVLVLTGITSEEMLKTSPIQPTFVLPSVKYIHTV
jgi:arabinose operon protein AraL